VDLEWDNDPFEFKAIVASVKKFGFASTLRFRELREGELKKL